MDLSSVAVIDVGGHEVLRRVGHHFVRRAVPISLGDPSPPVERLLDLLGWPIPRQTATTGTAAPSQLPTAPHPVVRDATGWLSPDEVILAAPVWAHGGSGTDSATRPANNYALPGGQRAAALMISAEIAIGASIMGVVMVYGSLDMQDIARAQGLPLLPKIFGNWIPAWGIFIQPLGFLFFLPRGSPRPSAFPSTCRRASPRSSGTSSSTGA